MVKRVEKGEMGLESKEAEKRLAKFGRNEISEIGKASLFKILTRQIKNNFVIYLLLVAMTLSFIVGKNITAYAILGVILMVVSVGFFQEYKAEKAVDSLRKLITPISVVIRDGIQQKIPSNELVPGDILVLGNGEKIPADCIIIDSKELRVDESVLTGESVEIAKKECKNLDDPQEENMIYMGTFIVNGRCLAKVSYTGMRTKFGKIANLISRQEKEMPLQKKINKITKTMATVAIFFAILTGIIFFFRAEVYNYDLFTEAMIIAIALAVSAFPEGFPVALVTTLSSGAYRMAKKNAIVNRMSIIETLGETTVICSDKTGTITRGEMTVKSIYADDKTIDVTGNGYDSEGELLYNKKKIEIGDNRALDLLGKASVLCNDSEIQKVENEKEFNTIGTGTEVSLLVMASKLGITKETLNAQRLDEISFSSSRKLMSVLSKLGKDKFVFTKGAPEIVIDKCSRVQRNNGVFTLTRKEKERILEKNKEFNLNAYRTVGIAYKPFNSKNRDEFEEDLIFLGFVAMEDPPRKGVLEAIEECIEGGIKVKMITGDNKETAISIASQIGLKGLCLTGNELDKISDEKLKKMVDDIVIFARVNPEHKLRIVNALKTNGEIVTMTGDGVNDAPALKAAHIGVAMGKKGTDVSREVSDLILKDDHFSSILEAVKEGRTIFNNMKKFTTYQLSCSYAEIFIIFLGIAIGLPLPLVAIQILFMNLVTSDITAITLGLNPSSTDIMAKKPRKNSNLLNKDLTALLLIAGLVMGLGTLGVFYFVYSILGESLEIARTSALVSLIIFEIANAFNFRSFRKGVLNRSPFVNRYLFIAGIISILLTILIIHSPLNSIFQTVPLSAYYWMIALIPAISIIFVFDLLKFWNNKKNFWNELN